MNLSQMTVAQMSINETIDSPQHKPQFAILDVVNCLPYPCNGVVPQWQ